MSPVHLTLLVLTSAATLSQAVTSKDSKTTYQTRLTGSILIYPFMSSLSTAFLRLFFDEHDSRLNLSFWFFSTGMSTLVIAILIQLRYHSIFIDSALQNCQQQRDEALHYAQEQEFIGSMLSHDSRNILHCLVNSLNFLEIDMGAANANVQKTKENLSGAKYCCETLLNYFNNYLENFKLAGNQQISKASLPEVLQRVQGIIKSAIEFNKLEAKITLEENTPHEIFFNESSLTQIMLNLIYNSIKFTEEGSINVSIGWKSGNTPSTNSHIGRSPKSFSECLGSKMMDSLDCISTRSTLCDLTKGRSPATFTRSRARFNTSNGLTTGTLIIKVSDTGCGMTPQEIDLLFQPFSQTHKDPTKRRQGSGLGLWLTKTLVEKLDGHIKVESRVGKGSTFTIEIGCQAKFEKTDQKLKKELTVGSMRTINTNSRFAGKAYLTFNESPFENFLIKAYMKNFGIENLREFTQIEELGKYLETCINEEQVIVLDEKHVSDLNGLHGWNRALLSRKLVIILGEEGPEKVKCDMDGSQRLERPVKFSDFSQVLTAPKKAFERRKGGFEIKLLDRRESLELVN